MRWRAGALAGLTSLFVVAGLAFRGGLASAETGSVVAAPDGRIWFTELGWGLGVGPRIAWISSDGRAREWPLGADAPSPRDITAEPGGVWFTLYDDPRIGRITAAGRVRYWRVGGQPQQIAAGPDHSIWFTDASATRIGRINAAGRLRLFHRGVPEVPTDITAGPDGAVWFVSGDGFGPASIGRITAGGRITRFTRGIDAFAELGSITTGPDGNLWFTEPNRDAVGRITPAGVITTFWRGITTCAGPEAITTGPDGNLWFAEPGGADDPYADAFCPSARRVGRITPEGHVTEYPVGVIPGDITAAADGNVWFTEPDRTGLGRLTTDGEPTHIPSLVAVDRLRVHGHRTMSFRIRCTRCAGVVRVLAYDERHVVARTRFAARAGHPDEVVLTLNRTGRVLLAARGRLPVTVLAQPTRLQLGTLTIGSGLNGSASFADPAAISGVPVNLPVTPSLRRTLHAVHVHRRSNAHIRGPLGAVYYARLNRGEWAVASFTALADQPEIFNRPVGGRWVDLGDTGGTPGCSLPRPLQGLWNMDCP